MNDPTEVEPYRPPRQWSRQDLDTATARGDHARIAAALTNGQLADVLAAGNPEPRTPRPSAPMDHDVAAEIHRNLNRQETK